MYIINNEKYFFTVNKYFYVFVVFSLLTVMISCSPIEPVPVGNQLPREIAKIIAANGATASSRFGHSVAIDGDYAIVSTELEGNSARISGSAYIFTRFGENWIRQEKFLTTAMIDDFGNSVAISGDTAIVGARLYFEGTYTYSNAREGAAFIYVRNGIRWTQQAKIKANDATPFDWFGNSVAIDGDYVIVGAPFDDVVIHSGSAYIFNRSGGSWNQQAKLTANDGSANANFGNSVAIDGDTAIVGACAQDSAYIFARNGSSWSQQAKLTASDRTAGDNFGCSVAIDSNTVIVGAKQEQDDGDFTSTYRGAAYIFTRSGNNWSEQAKIKADDAAANDVFGISVSIKGDKALVGAQGDDDNGKDSGSVYLFTRNESNWTQQTKLLASDGGNNDRFGYSVSMDGDRAIVGAIFDNVNGRNRGSSYIYQLQENP